MNEQIMKFLLAKKESTYNMPDDWIIGYNRALKDCAEAIERAVKEGTLVIKDGVSDLVRCPTEEEIIYMMYDRDAMGTKTWEKKPEEIAKALLALLHRTAPQNVSNSAT